MKVLSRQAMQQVDHQALATYGLPTLALMENAGRWVAQRAGALLGDAHGRRVVVVCGGGNNGGDALVAARHLHNWGARVWAVMAVEGWPSNPRLSELAATQLEVVRRLGVEVLGLQEEGRRRLDLVLEAADLVVDGVLGTGTRGAPRGAALEAVRWMQQARAPVLAVDIPSGVDTDTGQVPGPAVAAVETVTFGLPKPAHVLYPAAGLCGRVWVADIGFPRALLDEAPAAFEVLEESQVAAWLPARPPAAHKGTFGHVLVVAGSRGMAGAGSLAARAALLAGAGLVTWAVPRSLQDLAASLVPEALTAGLADPGEEGVLSEGAWDALRELATGRDVVVAGPGLSTRPGVARLVARMVGELPVPMVLDADALNVLASQVEVLEQAGRAQPGPRLVLTPHPGEMARLLRTDVPSVQRDRVAAAQQAARRFGAVVVLKGAATVVAAPDGRTWVNPAALAALATGGSGDVLAGLIGGLLAQGMAPAEAACAGVFLHAWAGVLAGGGDPGGPVLAGQLAAALPQVFRALRAGERAPQALRPLLPLGLGPGEGGARPQRR